LQQSDAFDAVSRWLLRRFRKISKSDY